MHDIRAAQVFRLADMIQVKPGRIASRTLSIPFPDAEGPAGAEAVLYAMDEAETISTETSPRTKLIYVLEGELQMSISGEPCRLAEGASVLVLPNIWHEFAACTSCIFLQISL